MKSYIDFLFSTIYQYREEIRVTRKINKKHKKIKYLQAYARHFLERYVNIFRTVAIEESQKNQSFDVAAYEDQLQEISLENFTYVPLWTFSGTQSLQPSLFGLAL